MSFVRDALVSLRSQLINATQGTLDGAWEVAFASEKWTSAPCQKQKRTQEEEGEGEGKKKDDER
jgi:hypothetical protein